ncbi:hypothetical protein [Azotobacter beijerinckii]|uniref:Uncharacterized protein n=1 Tax=Azotobacter beijerinckii TaxID=170623 RepID=A0A1I4FV79_9GAMM|nr:hypothetical protein [Azotobacter beijerinckii]SFB61777.1 hypothetical protein SAMN04244571_04334 [Azotobacter beijerinckii]SFL21349.1 hypothetical protein SAMN04244574_03553 [Azotobacter beijerinckii]
MSSIDAQDVPEVDLREFARLIGLEKIAPGRYSVLLAANLLGGALSGRQNPAKIVSEIELLESGELGQFKEPIQNRHPPLKGLWHKHYMQDGLASLAMNVKKGLNRYGMPFFEQKVQEAKEAGELRYLTPGDVPALVDDIVSGNWQRLAEQQALSGEWIIFAQHEGQNYYLTIATHDSATHERVREQIDQVCCVEFPFLAPLLADA